MRNVVRSFILVLLLVWCIPLFIEAANDNLVEYGSGEGFTETIALVCNCIYPSDAFFEVLGYRQSPYVCEWVGVGFA